MLRISIIAACLALLLCAQGCSKNNFEQNFAEAEAKMGMGDARGALGALQKVAGRYPQDPRRPGVLLRIADIYGIVMDEKKQAVEAYGAVIDEYPLSEASMLAHERRARLMENAGNYAAAIEDYAALIKHFPDHADHYRYRVLMGGAYMAGGEYDQARTELLPLLEDEKTPTRVREQALFAIAESYFLASQHDEAVPYYQAFLGAFPKSNLAGEAKLHLATCVEEMGYLGTAHDIAREARKDYPNKDVVDARLRGIERRGQKTVEGTVMSPEADSRR